MELKEMKADWQAAKCDIRPGSEPDNNRKTALQRLHDEYRSFARMSLILLACGAFSFWNMGINPWLLPAYIILICCACAVDLYLARSIRKIDLARMPVKEVLTRTMKCRKIHLLWVAIALPIVILWCAALAYTMRADTYFIYGICTGAVLGLIIGLRVLLSFMRTYRTALRN